MKYLMLSLLFVLPAAANAQTVNGDIDAAFAVGKWKESHEGVSLFCARVTTEKEVTKGNSNGVCFLTEAQDRKSTRLNSSHLGISYAVFCLKKKICRAYEARKD